MAWHKVLMPGEATSAATDPPQAARPLSWRQWGVHGATVLCFLGAWGCFATLLCQGVTQLVAQYLPWAPPSTLGEQWLYVLSRGPAHLGAMIMGYGLALLLPYYGLLAALSFLPGTPAPTAAPPEPDAGTQHQEFY
jgi:hypothetical protein